MTHVTTRQTKVIVSIAVLTTISTIVFGLRVYARAFKLRKFGVDDWFMAAAYVWILFFEVAIIVQLFLGGGLKASYITPTMFDGLIKGLYACNFIYITAVCLVKVSILSLYLRLSVRRYYRVTAYVVMGITVAGSVICIVLSIFQCSLVSGFWTPLSLKTKCISMELNIILVSSFHITTDTVIYILPIPAIIVIQTSVRRKLGLIAIFALGAMPVAVSILRLLTLSKIDWAAEVKWKFEKLTTLSAAELNVALIAASLPAVRVVFCDMRCGRIPCEKIPNAVPLFTGLPGRRHRIEDVEQISGSNQGKHKSTDITVAEKNDSSSVTDAEKHDYNSISDEEKNNSNRISEISPASASPTM